jgi:hypothetical protein
MKMLEKTGFLAAIHVAEDSGFNRKLQTHMPRVDGTIITKNKWDFLDELKECGHEFLQ